MLKTSSILRSERATDGRKIVSLFLKIFHDFFLLLLVNEHRTFSDYTHGKFSCHLSNIASSSSCLSLKWNLKRMTEIFSNMMLSWDESFSFSHTENGTYNAHSHHFSLRFISFLRIFHVMIVKVYLLSFSTSSVFHYVQLFLLVGQKSYSLIRVCSRFYHKNIK